MKALVAALAAAVVLLAGCGGDKHYSDYKREASIINLTVISEKAAKQTADLVCDGYEVDLASDEIYMPDNMSSDEKAEQMALVETNYCPSTTS